MNNLTNLPPFYVGQKVIYITGHNMPKDSVHTVLDIKKDIFGCWRIYVKPIGLSYSGSNVKCSSCEKIFNSSNSLSADYIIFTSFRALKESPFPSMTAKEVITKELKLVSLN
jgi:hypothetical protein